MKRFIAGIGTVAVITFGAFIAAHASAAGSDIVPLAPGCQTNVAVGQFPAEAIKAIVDAHGTVLIANVGVYQLTVKGVTLHEDDERWLDLRDYEPECTEYLPTIKQ